MVDIFKALADETRLRIISILLDDQMCVCEIECCLKLSQSNASKHLRILKTYRILESYKNAQWTFYRINNQFKVNHKELWEYLQENLKRLDTYKTDRDEIKICRESHTCSEDKR